MTTPYIPKPTPVRPGSQDAFALPSRQGDKLIPRKPPIILGSGVSGAPLGR